MDISELIFAQKHGICFVWKMRNGKMLITFLRDQENISPQRQLEGALYDGCRKRKWTLIGVGHWYHATIEQQHAGLTDNGVQVVSSPVHTITAAPLRLKNLSWREMREMAMGMEEMREKWIPYICEQLRKILREESEA